MIRRLASLATVVALATTAAVVALATTPAAAGPSASARASMSARTSAISAPVARAAAAPSRVNCAVQRCVALTFDDGPGAYTDTLLATLRAKKVPATFYLVGTSVVARPSTAKRIALAGHELGVHTWSHADLSRMTPGGIRLQITKGRDAIVRATGLRPRTLRPPYGASSSAVRAMAKSLGHPIVLWSVDPLDWKYRNSTSVRSRVLAATRPGAIVLMHDIHSTTVAAVPGIIDTLRARGYVFVRVSDLRPMSAGHTYSQR